MKHQTPSRAVRKSLKARSRRRNRWMFCVQEEIRVEQFKRWQLAEAVRLRSQKKPAAVEPVKAPAAPAVVAKKPSLFRKVLGVFKRRAVAA